MVGGNSIMTITVARANGESLTYARSLVNARTRVDSLALHAKTGSAEWAASLEPGVARARVVRATEASTDRVASSNTSGDTSMP